MVYRKGELSKGTIDRQWPHQVAVPADSCTGANWVRIQEFCKGMSLCPRGHFFYRDTIGFNVYCFGEREHAEQFLRSLQRRVHRSRGATEVASEAVSRPKRRQSPT